MRLFIFAALATAGIALPAIAKDEKPVDPNKKVCRSLAMTGSMFSKRVCHTAAEWQAIDDANNNAARALDVQRPPSQARP